MTKDQSGLVVDVEVNKAILLTPAGEFIAVKIHSEEPTPSIGEEYSIKPSSGNRLNYNYIVRYAALVAIFLVFVILPSANSAITTSLVFPQMKSYLVIDINPSLELGLDKNDYVRTATALNKDGELVLKNEYLIGKPVKVALRNVIDSAVKLGFINNTIEPQNILLTYVPAEDELSSKIDSNDLVEGVESSLVQNSITANVETLITNESTRQEAQELGISTGKYVVLREAERNGLEITSEELKAESLEKAITKSGGDFGQLLKQLKKEQTAQKVIDKITDRINTKIEQEELMKNNLDDKWKDIRSTFKEKILTKVQHRIKENNRKEAIEFEAKNGRLELKNAIKAIIPDKVKDRIEEEKQGDKVNSTHLEVEKHPNSHKTKHYKAKVKEKNNKKDNKTENKDKNKKSYKDNGKLKNRVNKKYNGRLK